MEFKELGKTGEKVPAIGMGTWGLGRNPKDESEALRAGLEKGMRFIDTAEMYGTEGLVGEAIRGEELFLATKVSPSHFRHDDVIKACDASLKRLGIKSVDLYQLHWPNHRVPIRETMQAMEELADAGKIRHIGVSNFDVGELREARESMKRHEIVSNQVEYSVLARGIEQDLMPYCAKEHVTIIAYSPFAHGLLFDKRYEMLRRAMGGIGASHGKSAVQVALSWLVTKPNVVAIPKASTREHMLDIAGAVDFRLSDDELDAVTRFLG